MTLSLMSLQHLIAGPSPDAAWNFTLDEIRQQLSHLGVTNLSDSHICQLKEQLDDLIAKELEHVQVASELSCCRIEDPTSSHLDSVSKFSSDSGGCTTPEPEMHKSLSDLDSHHTVLTFDPQSNYSNRRGQSTERFSKLYAWARPCRSAKTAYLSHVLQSDVRTESEDTVSSISDISDSSAIRSPAEQSVDDVFSAHSTGFFRHRDLEYPSPFPCIGDLHFRRHHESHGHTHIDCNQTSVAASSTLGPQITRVKQCDGSPTAQLGSTTSHAQPTFCNARTYSQSSCISPSAPEKRSSPTSGSLRRPLKVTRLQRTSLSPLPAVASATVAPNVNSRPLSTCDPLRPSSQRQTEERGSPNISLRTLHLPPTRTTNFRHGLAYNPAQTLPSRRSGLNSSHPPSSQLETLRGSQRSRMHERTVTYSDVARNVRRNRHSVSPAAESANPAARHVVRSAGFTDQQFEKNHDVPLRSIGTTKPFRLEECREVKRPASATTTQDRSRIARLARRKDPVSRFQQYQRIWLTHLVPGEDARRVLRWNIKTAMMHREVPLLQRNLAEISQLFDRDVVVFLERERSRHLKSLQPIMLSTRDRHHPQDLLRVVR